MLHDDRWRCLSCGIGNDAKKKKCAMCKTSRPKKKRVRSRSSSSASSASRSERVTFKYADEEEKKQKRDKDVSRNNTSPAPPEFILNDAPPGDAPPASAPPPHALKRPHINVIQRQISQSLGEEPPGHERVLSSPDPPANPTPGHLPPGTEPPNSPPITPKPTPPGSPDLRPRNSLRPHIQIYRPQHERVMSSPDPPDAPTPRDLPPHGAVPPGIRPITLKPTPPGSPSVRPQKKIEPTGVEWISLDGMRTNSDSKHEGEILEEQKFTKERQLLRAVVTEKITDVTSLLESSANVNYGDRFGRTALLWASRKGNVAIADLLLSARADVNQHQKTGETALIEAAEYGNVDLVIKLLDADADPSDSSNLGETPLIRSAYSGHLEVVKELLSAGADVNKADQKGDTALMKATLRGHGEVVQEFLRSELIDLELVNENGHTVFDTALRCVKNPLKVVQILSNYFLFAEARFISYSKLHSIQMLDVSGKYGDIYTAKLNIGETKHGFAFVDVVCKVPKLTAGPNEWFELQTLQNIPRHKNVVGLLAMCTGFQIQQNAKLTAMILLFRRGGSLLKHLESRKEVFNPNRLLQFAVNIVQGVHHLHSNGYKHCDIAARNFLMSEPESVEHPPPSQCIALTDFGLSRPVTLTDPLTDEAVPWRWCSPEVLRSRGVTSPETDVYMVGIAIWELTNSPYQRPFFWASSPQSLVHYLDKKHINFDRSCHPEVREIIIQCCHKESMKRPTTSQLLALIEAAKLACSEDSVASDESCLNELESDALLEGDSDDILFPKDYVKPQLFDIEDEVDEKGPEMENGDSYDEIPSNVDKVVCVEGPVERSDEGRLQNNSLFLQAAEDGDEKTFSELISTVDVNYHDEFGNTALIWSSRNGNEAFVQRLIQTSANVNLTQKRGEAPITEASEQGEQKIVEMLISAKCDVNHSSKFGDTALMRASENGHVDIVELLLSFHANVNQIDQYGKTAIMRSALAGHRNCVRKLLAARADLSISDKNNRSVFDFAIESAKEPLKMVKILSKLFAFPEARFVPYSSLESVTLFAEGNFARVYLSNMLIGETKHGPAYVPVVCKVSKSGGGSDEWYELQTLQNIPNHPNVLSLLALCTGFPSDGNEHLTSTAMILIYYEGGQLHGYLEDTRVARTYKRMLEFGLDMSLSVNHLHKHGYKHCDIATRNFLLINKEQEQPDQQLVILTDFGLTRPLQVSHQKEALIPWRWSAIEVLQVGPEILSLESDYWMLGVSIWEMVNMPYKFPFQSISDPRTLLKHLEEEYLEFPPTCPTEIKTLVLRCCDMEPQQRPTARQTADTIQELLNTLHFEDLPDIEDLDVAQESDSKYDGKPPVIRPAQTSSKSAVYENMGSFYSEFQKGPPKPKRLISSSPAGEGVYCMMQEDVGEANKERKIDHLQIEALQQEVNELRKKNNKKRSRSKRRRHSVTARVKNIFRSSK